MKGRAILFCDDEAYALVKRYSNLTGIPMKRAVSDALKDWMEIVGESKLMEQAQYRNALKKTS